MPNIIPKCQGLIKAPCSSSAIAPFSSSHTGINIPSKQADCSSATKKSIMENHAHLPKFWLLFVLLFSASSKSEGTIGPQPERSNRFYSKSSGARFSNARQENGNILEDVAQTLSNNPSAASGGISEMIASIMAMPSGSPGMDGSEISDIPMGSNPAMVTPMATPMISPTSFAGEGLNTGDSPIASISPVVSNDVSATLLASPSPEMPAPTISPIATELISPAAVLPTMTMEPEPNSETPAPSQTDDVTSVASPTPLVQETLAPMMSLSPSEFPSFPPGDGIMDMPLVSASPTFGVSPMPSNIGEVAAASASAAFPSPSMELSTPSMDVQTTATPEETSPDASSIVSPQPSSLIGTPLASMTPIAPEASDGPSTDETPSPSAMSGIQEMMTAQASLTPEASSLMTPDPSLSPTSPGSLGQAGLEPFDISTGDMEDIDDDEAMMSPGATEDVMTPIPSFSPPMMTMSMMASATPTSVSVTPSISLSSSPSMSTSASPSMSSSLSPSPSGSASPSASRSASVAPSISSSMTPSASASVTPSASMSATPSASASPMPDEDESPVAPTRTPRPNRGPKRTPRPNRSPKRTQRPNGGAKQRPSRPRTNEVATGSVSDIEYETIRVGPKPLQKWLDSGTEEARKIVWGVGPHMP